MIKSLVAALLLSATVVSIVDADILASSPDAGAFDDATPFTSTISIAENEIISDVIVSVSMSHSWVGDVTATVTHVQSGFSIELVPTSLSDSSNLGFDLGDDTLIPGLYVFSDTGTETIGTAAGNLPNSFDEIPLGTYLASDGTATGTGSFATVFGGDSTLGDWRLDLSDSAGGDDGIVSGWSLFFFSAPAEIPEPGSLALLGLAGLGILARRRR